VAHNGKCADRLMSKTPAKALHSLLRTNFNDNVPENGGSKMTLNSIYSLVVALPKGALETLIPESVTCAFVKQVEDLRFVSCNTRKYRHLEDVTSDVAAAPDVEVWTILSSPSFAKRHKAPQENIPKAKEREVTDLLLASLSTLVGGEINLQDSVLESRLQLWGAAVPLNTWSSANAGVVTDEASTGFVYDAEHGVGACGDWLLEPSIEGAWESGRRLANWMTQEITNEGEDEKRSVGLPDRVSDQGGRFVANASVLQNGIGSFSR